MSVVLDIILLSVIVFCIVSYYRKGFAASAVGFARFIIAAGLSFALSGLVADLISSSVEKTVGEDNASYIAYALAFVLVFAAAMVLLGFAERFLGGFISSFPILFSYTSSQSGEQISMYYTAGPCWLSILNIAVCTCPSQTS